MEFTGVTITGGVLVESAGIVPVDNAFRMTITNTNSGVLTVGSINPDEPNPLVGGTIDWGDSNTTAFNDAYQEYTHTYDSVGNYQISVTGFSEIIDSHSGPVTSIDNFGNVGVLALAFYDNPDLTSVPSNLPNTAQVLRDMFSGCTNFNDANISLWDTSNVVIMATMFTNCENFDQSLNDWNTANVQSMGYMFSGASSFNQPLNNWDVSNVTWNTTNGYPFGELNGFQSMFQGAASFNQPLDQWDVSGMVDSDGGYPEGFEGMFIDASSFVQDLSMWNVANVSSIDLALFCNPTNDDGTFPDGYIPVWGTWPDWANALVMTYNNQFGIEFYEEIQVIVDTGDVNSSRYLDVAELVDQFGIGNTPARLTINKANPISIGNLYFYNGNQIGITSWGNLGTIVLDMDSAMKINDVPTSIPTSVNQLTIKFADTFNSANVITWNTSNVSNMFGLFKDAAAFNQDIGNWNTANVTNMERMFENATVFNQDLTGWCVTNIASEPSDFATSSALDANNYPVWGTCP